MDKVRGVNLGGWLVLERWIAPSVFEGTDAKDEYSLCRLLDAEEATRRLERHRDGFITEDHISRLVELGINTVRLPVGYWLFGGEPPYVDGGNKYVERLFEWADKYQLGVILDFHGAPGSQNGWHHSGQAGSCGWHRTEANTVKSLQFIERLAQRYGGEPSLIGIEVLNEPHWQIPLEVLVDYYQQSAAVIRANSRPEVAVIVSDAFRPLPMSKALRRHKLKDLVLDIHLYQLFTPEDRELNLDGHIKKVEKDWNRLLRRLGRHHDLLVGEWSAAMSELYEPATGKRHDYGPADYESYAYAQQQLFAKRHIGWTYWTARTEGGGPWSILDRPGLLRV